MIEIRNLFHEGGSPADLRYKEEERKRAWEIAEKTAREECTLDWSQSKVFLVAYIGLFAVPENPTLEPKITTLSYTEPEL